MHIIRSHRKDVNQAKSIERPTQKSKAKEKQAKERDILNNTWKTQLDEMKTKAETKQERTSYTRDFLRKQDEEELQRQQQLQQQEEEEFNRKDYNTQQVSSPELDRVPRRENKSNSLSPITRDTYLDISKQDALRQYDISKTIKLHRQEKLVEKAHYIQVERALNSLDQRVQQLNLTEKQKGKDAALGGQLIGRTVSKLIQVNHEKITEQIVDDMCFEMVALLSAEEGKKSESCEKMTRESLVNDYLDEFRDLAYEQVDIVERMRKAQVNRELSYEPQFINLRQTMPHEYENLYVNPQEAEIKNTKIELSLGILVTILEKKSEFTRYTNRLDHYQKKNLSFFDGTTEAIIDELLVDVTRELEKANNSYAELMFQHEFK